MFPRRCLLLRRERCTNWAVILPVGYRPLISEIFNGVANMNVVSGAASTGTAHTHTAAYQLPIRVDVNATGTVTVNAQAGTNLPAGAYVSISGINFTLD